MNLSIRSNQKTAGVRLTGRTCLGVLPLGLASLILSSVACSDSTPKPIDVVTGRGGSGGSSSGSGGAGRSGSGGGGGVSAGSGGQTGTGGTPAGTGGTSQSGGSGGSGQGGATTDGSVSSDAKDVASEVAGEAGTPGPGLAGYKYLRSIKLDTSAAGANVAMDVEKYPLAITLNAMNFDFAQAKEKGEDVRFAKNDGTILPHSVELWDRATSTAVLWVKVDLVKGNDSAQTIQLHWGNAAATDAGDTKAVFPQAEGFVGVYHLDDEGSTTAGGYKDASSHEAHATGMNLMPAARVDGRIGKGTNLQNPAGGTAAARWIRMNDAAKLMQFNTLPKGSAISISIWTKATTYPTSYCTIMSKGDTSWTLQRVGTSNTYEPCHHWGGTAGDHLCAVSNAKTAAGQWVHFAALYQEPNVVLYVNGVEDKRNSMAGWDAGDHAFGIGNQTQFEARRFWDGIMDEARVMRGVRSPAWIKLDFESQREGQKLLTFGPVQTR